MPNVPMNNFTLNRSFNPNAEYSIGNLVAFADAAGTAPVDGTGGSPTVTITRTISSPLEGIASILFTKDAANRQGEGFSGDVVLQASDATKMFTLSFDYQITTGTYTGYQVPPLFSDLTFWVYDITNAVMYQVMGNQLDGSVSTTNQYTFQGQWQVPVGCLQARVIGFLGNTSASAFTAKFNNISFGRIPRVQGNIGTPWTSGASLTPNSFGTVTNQAYFSSRSQDTLSFEGYFTAGTVAGGAAYVQLPPGIQIDTTKIAGTQKPDLGDWGAATSGAIAAFASNARSGPITYGGTATLVYFSQAGASGLINLSAANAIAGNNDGLIFKFTIPVLGWGANGTLGQDADTRVVSAKYAMGTSFGLGSNLTLSQQFDTRAWDTHGAATYGIGVTFTYYAPVSGFYRIKNSFVANSTAFTTSVQITGQALVGTSASVGSILFNRQFDANLSIAATDFGTCELQLKAGDPLNLTIACAGITSSLAGNTSYNIVEIDRLSGPAQIQAADNPTASYSTNAGQSISNAATPIIDFEDVTYDTFGCVTTGASWKFTCPRAGKIKVQAMITYASGVFTINTNVKLYCYKNGALYRKLDEDTIMATITDDFSLTGSTDVSVAAGDTIDFRTDHGESAARSLTTTTSENYCSIAYWPGF